MAKTIVKTNPNKPKRLTRILAITGIGIAFFAFSYLFVGSAIKNLDAYKVAIQNIEVNNEIIEETGGITGYGTMTTGSVSNMNGHGRALLNIKVRGKEKNLKLVVYLEKEPNGQWELIKLNK